MQTILGLSYIQVKQIVLFLFTGLVFYVNIRLLIPKYLFKRFWFKYTGFIVVLLVMSFYTHVTLSTILPHKHRFNRVFNSEVLHPRFFMKPDAKEMISKPVRRDPSKRFAISYVFTNLLAVTLGASIGLTRKWYLNEKRMNEIQIKQVSSELAALKSQINPHFYFNILNAIFSLASRKSDKAPDAIMRLSQLMRFVIYDSNQTKVQLEKELAHIGNYLDLQKLRMKSNIQIEFNTMGDVDNEYIAPMLLLPFIENAFKHGINNSIAYSILIDISITDSVLSMKVDNPIFDKLDSEKFTGEGIGQQNTIKRLQLLYPGKHKLNIEEDNNKYHVCLQLILS